MITNARRRTDKAIHPVALGNTRIKCNIKALAYARKLNLHDIADMLNVDHVTVLYWNQNRIVPRLHTCFKLCRILGVTLNDLFTEEPADNE